MDKPAKNNSKSLIAVTALLFVVCLALGGYGLYLDKFAKKEVNVSYTYYVNGEVQKNMPGEGDGYEFDKYKCDNNIKGKWDEKTWKFTPKAEKSGKCKIYFVDKKFKVNLVAPDGVTISGKEELEVKKDEPAEFEIALKESVSVKEITCTNEQKAVFKDDKVTLEELSDDTTCTIVTEDAKHSVEVKAINGKVTDYKKDVVYGESIVYTVSANNGFTLDAVTCTNNQTGSWSNGKLTVEKVTNDTICTVKFKASQYTVSVKVVNGKATDGTTKTIDANGTVSFAIIPNSGTNATKISCTNGQTASYANNSLVISKVTANTTCTVSFPTE